MDGINYQESLFREFPFLTLDEKFQSSKLEFSVGRIMGFHGEPILQNVKYHLQDKTVQSILWAAENILFQKHGDKVEGYFRLIYLPYDEKALPCVVFVQYGSPTTKRNCTYFSLTGIKMLNTKVFAFKHDLTFEVVFDSGLKQSPVKGRTIGFEKPIAEA